jgi:hypothetical protein
MSPGFEWINRSTHCLETPNNSPILRSVIPLSLSESAIHLLAALAARLCATENVLAPNSHGTAEGSGAIAMT